MENKEVKQERTFCAIPTEMAQAKLKELLDDPVKKEIIEEFQMWLGVLQTPVQQAKPKEDVKETTESVEVSTK